jgi:hypothetical protein
LAFFPDAVRGAPLRVDAADDATFVTASVTDAVRRLVPDGFTGASAESAFDVDGRADVVRDFERGRER